MQAWVMVYGGWAVPWPHASPPTLLSILTRSKVIQSITFGANLAAKVTRRLAVFIANQLGFSVQISFQSLFCVWIWLQSSGGLKIKVLLSLNGLPSQVDVFILPKAADYVALVVRLCPFSDLEPDWVDLVEAIWDVWNRSIL